MATTEEVQKLAALARLTIPEDRLAAFARDFDAILAYIGQLESLTLPETGARVPALRNVFRKDGEPHAPGAHSETLIGAFPESEEGYLKVKQIISHD